MKAVAALLVVQAVAVAGFAGLSLLGDPEQPVGVHVLDVADPDGTGYATEVRVRVTNPGPEPLAPRFFVPANELMNWYPWPATGGPDLLGPGEAAEYVIRQPAYTGVPVDQGFRVAVMDGEGRAAYGMSPVASGRPPGAPAAVLNPGFRHWQPSMIAGYALPIGWIPFSRLDAGDSFTVTGGDGDLRLHLAAAHDAGAEDVAFAAVRQRIDFPSALQLDFRTSGTAPGGVFGGVAVEDHAARRRVLFVDAPAAADGDAAAGAAPEDHAALARWLETAGEGWTTRVIPVSGPTEVDVVALWSVEGWHPPAQTYLPRLVGHGPEVMGVGAPLGTTAQGKFAVMRPLELRVFLLADPAAGAADATLTASLVGGPSLDSAPAADPP